jgi:hypothetical protein
MRTFVGGVFRLFSHPTPPTRTRTQGTLGAGVYVLASGACKVEIQLEISVWNERAQCAERHTMAPLALFEVRHTGFRDGLDNSTS